MVPCKFISILDVCIQRRLRTPHKRPNYSDVERGRPELQGYKHPSSGRAIAVTRPSIFRSSVLARLIRVHLSPFLVVLYGPKIRMGVGYSFGSTHSILRSMAHLPSLK